MMTKSCWVWLRRSIFIDTQLWAASITSRHAFVRTCRSRSGQDCSFRMGPDRAKGASLNPLYGGNVAKAKSRAHGVPKLDAGWTITHPSHTHRVARGRKMGRSTPRRPPRPKPNTIWQPGHAHCPPHPQSSTASKVLTIGTDRPPAHIPTRPPPCRPRLPLRQSPSP